MAQVTPALKFQVEPALFDENTFRDENNFYHQKQGNIDHLTTTLTYILGKHTNQFPIALRTIGASGYNPDGSMSTISKEVDDTQYDYPVMSRLEKTSLSAGKHPDAGSSPGIGNSVFPMQFTDRHIKRFSIIQNSYGRQVYIHDDGVERPGVGWVYQAQLDPADPEEFLSDEELAYGEQWIDITRNVAESQSRTTETTMKQPGSYKNQIGFHRLGTSWAGNAANKVMKIKISDGTKEMDLWMDWAAWQMEMDWLHMRENNFWYSKYNRRSNGTIPLKDLLTGKVIPRGSGLLEQITNRTSVAKVTYNFISNMLGDIFYQRPDKMGRTITLSGGKGAKRDFHQMIMNAGAQMVGLSDVADKFVTGTGYNLALGGYFDTLYLIDGYVVKFKLASIFDTGKVAAVSPKHPVTGFSLESHRLVFIDDDREDGGNNLIHVHQKGRKYMDGIIKGLTPTPRSIDILLGNTGAGASKLLSTDMDQSSYTRFCSDGIQLMDGTSSIDIQCTAGL